MKNTVVQQHLLQVCSNSPSSESEAESEVEEAVAPPLPESTPTARVMSPLAGTAKVNRGSDRRSSSCVSVSVSLYKRRQLSKQLSMRETKMEAKWEKRRRQILKRKMKTSPGPAAAASAEAETAPASAGGEEETAKKQPKCLTDEDLDELKGSIDLGFGFNEEEGAQDLCDTLPALNLYFAVNRQVNYGSKVQTPTSAATTTPTTITSSTSSLCGIPSPRSPNVDHQQAQSDSWKICNPGDSPQHVKTRLRHWAQAVACSLKQVACILLLYTS